MATDVTQIKVTLPDPLMDFLASKAGKFGVTVSSYVKNLIINDVKDMDFPVYRMSEKTEAIGLQALEDYRAGKTIEIKDIDEYFDNL